MTKTPLNIELLSKKIQRGSKSKSVICVSTGDGRQPVMERLPLVSRIPSFAASTNTSNSSHNSCKYVTARAASLASNRESTVIKEHGRCWETGKKVMRCVVTVVEKPQPPFKTLSSCGLGQFIAVWPKLACKQKLYLVMLH